MESTRMTRSSRHGMADAGWRGASGSGRDCSGRPGSMWCGRRGPRGMARNGNAGVEKPVKARGMEGSGTVGIVEARQVRMGMMRNGAERSGGSGHGTARKRRRGASRKRGER